MALNHPNYWLFYENIFSNIIQRIAKRALSWMTSNIACKSGQAEQIHIRVIQKSVTAKKKAG